MGRRNAQGVRHDTGNPKRGKTASSAACRTANWLFCRDMKKSAVAGPSQPPEKWADPIVDAPNKGSDTSCWLKRVEQKRKKLLTCQIRQFWQRQNLSFFDLAQGFGCFAG